MVDVEQDRQTEWWIGSYGKAFEMDEESDTSISQEKMPEAGS